MLKRRRGDPRGEKFWVAAAAGEPVSLLGREVPRVLSLTVEGGVALDRRFASGRDFTKSRDANIRVRGSSCAN
jgi:hypothetical protein